MTMAQAQAQIKSKFFRGIFYGSSAFYKLYFEKGCLIEMNFKETWNNTKKKALEIGTKAKEKACVFICNHPYISTGAALVIGFMLNEAMHSDQPDYALDRKTMETMMDAYDYEQNECNRPGRAIEIEHGMRTSLTSGWTEEYRASYDKVKAFADELPMVKGEMFIIEPASTYSDDEWFVGDPNKPVVSHLINGDGCYPPENN